MTVATVSAKNKCISCKLHTKKVRTSVNLASLSEIFSRLESATVLGGNAANRFSYWAAEPVEVFEFKAGQENPFEKLQRALGRYRLERDLNVDSRLRGNDKNGYDKSGYRLEDSATDNLPKGMFCGGWAGYFGYELGRFIERVPVTTIDDLKMPLIRLCFYDKLICYDHIEDNWRVIALELAGEAAGAVDKLDALESLLSESNKISVAPPGSADLDNIDFSQIRCNIDQDYYFGAIEKIKRYIYDGDVYQVNFSQRFECDYDAEAIKLFGWQNHYNPSNYAAYIDGGDFTIVSASPEMFITIADGVISTKPIKGTRPRISEGSGADPQAKQINERNFGELAASEKENAELNMIIDLERNDLGRICEYGTIKVIQPRTVESYPTVFHAAATVAGQLRGEITFCDILKGMFPGGSITGAPKISSMKIIDETEPTARGVYTGSIGFIGIDGSACLNIAIRTIIIKDKKAFAQTGGGIVADSDAKAEWNETITKARALLAGINSVMRIAY